MVSAASLTAATVMATAIYLLPNHWATYPGHFLPEGWTLRIVGTLVAVLIFWRHRSNIQRILKGEENRF
jgi:glycerol-3-phosphate acyltransferase PlsY